MISIDYFKLHWRAITAMAICLTTGYWLGVDRGEWKSTGDGRTIVNSRTGELRLTSTGEAVSDYRQRIAVEQKAEVLGNFRTV